MNKLPESAETWNSLSDQLQQFKKYKQQFISENIKDLSKKRFKKTSNFQKNLKKSKGKKRIKNYHKIHSFKAKQLRNLGKVPSMAFDLILAQFPSNLIPFIGNIQPINELKGLITFNKLKTSRL